jgi:hypothetical protein
MLRAVNEPFAAFPLVALEKLAAPQASLIGLKFGGRGLNFSRSRPNRRRVGLASAISISSVSTCASAGAYARLD